MCVISNLCNFTGLYPPNNRAEQVRQLEEYVFKHEINFESDYLFTMTVL